jgi:tRNA(Ile)-lysidine synthase
MLQKLSNIITENFPFLKDKKLLIAISGGIDSVVLTHLLSTLNFDISLAHCNFNLRGKESDLDEVFVKELAKNLQVNCYTTSFETDKTAKEQK